MIERLEQRLQKTGVKGLVTRSGFGRFLRIHGEEAAIDREKVERDSRYDGLWVLDTSTDPPAKDVAEAYKSLWRFERAFRTLKSPLELRPVCHWTWPRIRGHVVAFFLAFLVRTALERRLFEDGDLQASFAQVLDALHRVQQVQVEVKGIPLQLHTEPPPNGPEGVQRSRDTASPTISKTRLTRPGVVPNPKSGNRLSVNIPAPCVNQTVRLQFDIRDCPGTPSLTHLLPQDVMISALFRGVRSLVAEPGARRVHAAGSCVGLGTKQDRAPDRTVTWNSSQSMSDPFLNKMLAPTISPGRA